MQKINLESTNIESIGFDPIAKELFIWFKNRKIDKETNKEEVYVYKEVEEIVYLDLLSAESKGKQFFKEIKSKYEFEKIEIDVGVAYD